MPGRLGGPFIQDLSKKTGAVFRRDKPIERPGAGRGGPLCPAYTLMLQTASRHPVAKPLWT